MSSAAAATQVLRDLVGRNFPSTRWAVAYGSGAVKQLGYPPSTPLGSAAGSHTASGASNGGGSSGNRKQPVIDLLLAVDDPRAWHDENIRRNPGHYSFLGWLGAGVVSRVQGWGAGVYYNTHVRLAGSNQTFKYGVIAAPTLREDLEGWNHLHVAGRLQKPVLPILGEGDSELAAAIQANRQMALRASCLLLPPTFTEIELFSVLAQLSYMDDIRWTLGLGENPHKVSNIVRGSYPEFRSLYAPLMQELGLNPVDEAAVTAAAAAESRGIGSSSDGGVYVDQMLYAGLQYRNVVREACSPSDHLELLPAAIRRGFPFGKPGQQLSHDDLAAGLSRQLRGIVRTSSRSQALKGVLTAGLSKSLTYVAAKFSKARSPP